jgi:hypothetical protein
MRIGVEARKTVSLKDEMGERHRRTSLFIRWKKDRMEETQGSVGRSSLQT